jgi:hypothetical protein
LTFHPSSLKFLAALYPKRTDVFSSTFTLTYAFVRWADPASNKGGFKAKDMSKHNAVVMWFSFSRVSGFFDMLSTAPTTQWPIILRRQLRRRSAPVLFSWKFITSRFATSGKQTSSTPCAVDSVQAAQPLTSKKDCQGFLSAWLAVLPTTASARPVLSSCSRTSPFLRSSFANVLAC